MKPAVEALIRFGSLAVVWLAWWWALDARLSPTINLLILIGAVPLVFPWAWVGRIILDRDPTPVRLKWTTMFVHIGVGLLFGLGICRALTTYQDWRGWILPIPAWIGLVLVYVTAAACTLAVINLALKGLGAPFYIALSRKLAMDWMYAWTRNPMVLAALALLVSLGIYYQSALFLLWSLILVTPALLFFVKVYEERELELRFGASYLDYKARTPMLFPRKPAA